MFRSVTTTARLVTELLEATKRRFVPVMVTLTYADVDGWSPRHISEFSKRVREWARRQGVVVPYLWVAELQKRGAVHYHVLLWMPKGLTLPKPDKRGWWVHGMTRTERARNPVGYLAKYASKGDAEGVFPKGLRLSGFGGIAPATRQERAWWMLPLYLRESSTVWEAFRRRPGGGWLSKATGEIRPAAFGLVSAARGRVVVVRLTAELRALRGLQSSSCDGRRVPAAADVRQQECGPPL
jgi:hypothetical protein